jgi:Zn-dependent protease with chaperone function
MFFQHILGVFLVLLVPTNTFVIQPIFYLMKKNNFEEYRIKNRMSVDGYEVKIIDKELINAYATGIIPFSKTILIGKPLIRDLTREELLSIQLHEAGHLKKKHLNKLFFVNTVLCVIFYFLLVVRSHYLTSNSQILNIVIVGFLGAFYGLLVWYIPGKVQYKFELEADKYSVEKNGKENLISALNKLDLISKGDVSKGGITHPKLSVRLEHIYKV